MNLYKTTAIRPTDSTVACLWSGTQADARHDRKTMHADGMHAAATVEVDLPTSKTDLLLWLNTHFVDLGLDREGNDEPPRQRSSTGDADFVGAWFAERERRMAVIRAGDAG